MGANASHLRLALDALYYSGAYKAMAPLVRGVGAIFMLHRVYPGASGTRPNVFDPNGFLAVTPQFLDRAICRIKAAGIDLVDLDEAARRLKTGSAARFACFTLDDGYRDNQEHALAVFEAHDCPFTIFITTGFCSRKTAPWWIMLERLIAAEDSISVELDGEKHTFSCRTVEEKYSAYASISDLFCTAPGPVFHSAYAQLCSRYSLNIPALSEELIMGWAELANLAGHKLATLGAHTVSHPVLANHDAEACRAEIEEGARTMADHLGVRPRHIAYPYGHQWAAGRREFELARELGFVTGVTTRKGVVFADHADHLTALPRVSLNGDYQMDRYVDVLLSGSAFALVNRFRRVSAA